MSLAKQLYYRFSNLLPISLLKSISPASTLLPYHHTVSNDNLEHIIHLYPYKNVAQFTLDLDHLLKHVQPVSPDELYQYIEQHHSLPKGKFLLTFDDGFREIYDVVAPILERKGVPALFFVNPNFVDNKELFYRCKTSLLMGQLKQNQQNKELLDVFRLHMQRMQEDPAQLIQTFKAVKFPAATVDQIAAEIGYSFDHYLQTHQPFVTTAQLHSLHQRGFTIGSHSWDHPHYPSLDLEEQLQQTIDSSLYVQSTFNENHRFFSFPYSDEPLGQPLFDALNNSPVQLMFGIQNQRKELNNKMVHRFNAERPEVAISHQLKGILLKSILDKGLGKLQVKRAK